MSIFELHKEKQAKFNKPIGRNEKSSVKTVPVSKFADGAKYKEIQADKKLMDSTCMNFKERQEFKKTLVEKYRSHVEGMIANGKISPVVTWWAMFLMDTDNMAEIVKIFPVLIDQGQKSPAEFKRTLAEVFHDKLALWAKHEFEEKKLNPKRPWLDISLKRLVDETDKVQPAILLASLKINCRILLYFERDNVESLREVGQNIKLMKESHHNPQIKTMIRDYEKACNALN